MFTIDTFNLDSPLGEKSGLAPSPVEPPTVEPPSVPKPPPPPAEPHANHDGDDDGDDDDGNDDDGDDGDGDGGPPQAPPPPPQPLPPPVPPSAPDAGTAPLGLSNPQPFGCELAGDEIVCEETGATLPFIRFDVDIPENAGFLQFDYTFTGADRAVSGTEGVNTAGRSDGEDRRRASVGDLGAVFIVNVPIAALPASGVLQEGVFQSSGQSGLPRSRRGTMFIANFPSGLAGSVFRVRNLRVDRCTQKCFGKRATLCGTDGRDELTGTRRAT